MDCPIARRAIENPDYVALKTGTESLSFRAWEERIAGMEVALGARGVKAGNRVALSFGASVDYATVLMALFRMGAIACPINPAFPDAYRADRLAQLDCFAHITEDKDEVVASGIEIPLSRLIGEASAARGPRVEPRELDAHGPAVVVFTSGSSGDPKAAVLSYGNLSHNALASNENICLGPGDTWLLSLPFHHVAGLSILFRCIHAGAAIGFPSEKDCLIDSANRLAATHLSLVARQFARMLETEPGRNALNRCKAILLGGSAIPRDLLAAGARERLPLFTSYGMTEMATQVTTTAPGQATGETLTSGRSLLPDTIRIGPDGAIEVNGPTRFLGYWDGGALRKPFDAAGWFTTGDRGHFDETGNLHVTGRVDNMFVAGGENIQPEVIERAFCALEGVQEAIVVPIPHPEFGATPVAFVDDRHMRSEAVLRECLAAALPSFLVPRHILPWPTDLAAEGMKVSRPALTRLAEQHLRSR